MTMDEHLLGRSLLAAALACLLALAYWPSAQPVSLGDVVRGRMAMRADR